MYKLSKMAINKKNILNLFYIFLTIHLIVWTAIPAITNNNLPLENNSVDCLVMMMVIEKVMDISPLTTMGSMRQSTTHCTSN